MTTEPEAVDLETLKPLTDAATDGLWHVWRHPHEVGNRFELRAGWQDENLHLGTVAFEADAAFIVAARTAVPALVAEVKRLRSDNRALRTTVDETFAAAEAERDALQRQVDEVSEIAHAWTPYDDVKAIQRQIIEALSRPPASQAPVSYRDGGVVVSGGESS